MSKKNILIGIVVMALYGCNSADSNADRKKSGQVDVAAPVSEDVAAPVVDDVDAPVSENNMEQQWCANGLAVQPINVSGTSWLEGFGRQVPSILLASGSIEDLSIFTTGELIGAGVKRQVKSARTTGNGRQIIIFDGDERLAPVAGTTMCLRSE